MVFINHPTKNQTLALDLPPHHTTLHDLQLAVHAATGVPPSHQRLYSAARPLPLHRPALPLFALGLRPTSALLLHLPLLGGMQAPPPPALPPPAAAPPAKSRLDFLHTKSPPNYVPRRHRLHHPLRHGPAGAAPDLPDRSAAAQGAGRGRGGGSGGEDGEGDEKGYDENQKFDEVEGNDVGLFASAEYDEDDKEADAVWEGFEEEGSEGGEVEGGGREVPGFEP